MFCPQCGAAPTPGGRFCGNCGTLLPFASTAGVAAAGPSSSAGVPAPQDAAGGDSRSSLAFTLAVVVCVVALGIVVTAATSALRPHDGQGDDRAAPEDRTRTRTDAQGPMGALLAPARRNDGAEAPKIR